MTHRYNGEGQKVFDTDGNLILVVPNQNRLVRLWQSSPGDPDNPLAYICGDCQRQPGRPCYSRNDRQLRYPHWNRINKVASRR